MALIKKMSELVLRINDRSTHIWLIGAKTVKPINKARITKEIMQLTEYRIPPVWGMVKDIS